MRYIYSAIIGITILAACKQDLCDLVAITSDNSSVKFTVDWSESNIDESEISNISIYAYPSDGGSPYLRVSGSVNSGYINLPVGNYSLLIFNDVVGDIANMGFHDISSYDDLYASLTESSSLSNLYYQQSDSEQAAYNHGKLAAWHMDSFEVTADMVSCPYCGKEQTTEVTLSATPTPVTTQCIFTIRVENLYNAQSIDAVVKGFARGAYVVSGERLTDSESTYIYSVTFTSRTFDDSEQSDGYIMGEITTFGKLPDPAQSYELVLSVILDSGELMTFTRDITDQVIEQDNITINITLDTTENMISLPEGIGTGFEVESWGDKEYIELL